MSDIIRTTIPSVYGCVSDTIDYAARIEAIRTKALALVQDNRAIMAASVEEDERDMWQRWFCK